MVDVSWVSANKDLLSVVLALIAISLTLFTVVLSRRQRRQEIFLRMHDLLTSPEMQEGRRNLYISSRSGQYPEEDSEEYRQMNRALSTLDTLGMYIRRRIVSEDWILYSWHRSLRDVSVAARGFADRRNSRHRWYPWPDLWFLLDLAQKYECKRICCVVEEVRDVVDERESTLTAD